jgi:hypothetical protein
VVTKSSGECGDGRLFPAPIGRLLVPRHPLYNFADDLLHEAAMPHAIIRGENGRRHEVAFGDESIRVEIHSSEETVEIFIEADFETLLEERRRFAILNIPRHLFTEASRNGAAGREFSSCNIGLT